MYTRYQGYEIRINSNSFSYWIEAESPSGKVLRADSIDLIFLAIDSALELPACTR